jgi:hypothetical protein
VARVALEVVDSAWWKQQLRVKSAGGFCSTPVLYRLLTVVVESRRTLLRVEVAQPFQDGTPLRERRFILINH